MNSNLKLLPAALLVAVLALAGCGGGSSDDMTPDEMPPMKTPQEKCTDDGGIYEDGECKSADDLREEGAKDAQEKEDEAAAAKAALVHYALLGTDAGAPAISAAVTENPAAFTSAKAADKFSQYMRLQGVKFSDIDPALTASTGDGLTGFFQIPSGSHADLKAASFGGISQKTHDANAPDGNRNDFVTTGTFRGVSGKLRCVGTCTSQDGSADGGAWHFMPDNAMDRVTGPKVEWGWWLTRDADGDVTVVNRFRHGGSSALTASSSLGDLGSGTASYEGDAAGQYAVIGDSGAFEAKATLSATFGNATIPLSGSIHTFTGADGESRDWMVELKEVAADATGIANAGTTVWTGDEMTGGWNAVMYNGTGDLAPNAILGDFKAENHGGRMTGVFGAKMQE